MQDRPETVVLATNAAWAASVLGGLAETILGSLLGDQHRLAPASRPDPLGGYDAWRLSPDVDITGTYLRLNSTIRVQFITPDDLDVEEMYSPQDEMNWFVGNTPGGSDRIRDRVCRVRPHSYESPSKQFHFLAHPCDPARLYIHNGMRANVRANVLGRRS